MERKSLINEYHSTLIIQHIQAINTLWCIYENNDHYSKQLNDLMNQMNDFQENSNKDLLILNLIKTNNNVFLKNILEDKKENLDNETVFPTNWIHIFNENFVKDFKDNFVQTDDIKKDTSEMSTQTSSIQSSTKEISTQTSLILTQSKKDNSQQSDNFNLNEQNIENRLSYANAIKSTPNKNNSNKSMKNEKCEIYNVKTNNYYEKLSTINANQPRTDGNQPIKVEYQPKGAPTKTNFKKRTSSERTSLNNPQQKWNKFRRSHPQQQVKTTNFNRRKPKFNAEVHSSSLQRDKWQKSPYNRENSPNNFNSNINNLNYYDKKGSLNSRKLNSYITNPKFYNNREFNSNFNYQRESNSYGKNQNFNDNRKFQSNTNNQNKNQNDNRQANQNFNNRRTRNSFKNDTFGNDLPQILISLFTQWIQSTYKSNQFYIKKKSFNNYENTKNQNFKPYGKIII